MPNGVLSENLAKQGRLVDMKATLQEFGMFDKFNKAAIDFLYFEDGSLYLYPEGKFGEAFWYYKKPFEENNIKVPANFDEFVQAAETLKQKGYTPIALSGKEMWQLVRYLSFVPLRLTHTKFINTLKTGNETFTGETGMKAANLLYTLGKNGYFQKGFSSMDYTQTLNFFLGGNAVMHYNGSWELAQFKDKYDKGEIGYFFVPDVAGGANIGPKTSITAGLAYAFNKDTFDAQTKDFFKFIVEHYNTAVYEVGGFLSPMNGIDRLFSECMYLFEEIAEVVRAARQRNFNSKVEEIIKLIESEYEEDISLDMLGDRFKLSTAYLSRLIRKETGKTFMDLLTDVRMEQARFLLTGSRRKVSEVAASVGYKDISYFIQVFKKRFGVTPNDYRETELRREREE